MIQLNKVSKWYGETQALHQISFSIKRGEVVGFLGPNGAGKSTTMKIITGYMPPTSGEVRIDGMTHERDSLAIRKKMGYLPEHNPLYMDTTVEELLAHVLRLRGIPKEHRSKAIDRAVTMTGISDVYYRPVHALSRGYRQRVGLAQALIHDPAILILDEPTAGLDPIQLQEIREVIAHIGQHHTVLLSTHIMQEVQAMCSKAIVIHQGQVVCEDAIQAVEGRLRGGQRLRILLQGNKQGMATALRHLPGVVEVEEIPDEERGIHRFVLTAEEGSDVRLAVFDAAITHGWKLLESTPETRSLEEVFIQLTRTQS